MSMLAISAERRLWLAKALMSLGVLYAIGSTVYAPSSWVLVNGAIFTGLIAGGLVIGHWGERPPPGLWKRACLMAFAVAVTVMAVWATLQGYI